MITDLQERKEVEKCDCDQIEHSQTVIKDPYKAQGTWKPCVWVNKILKSISRKFVTVWLGKSTYSTKKDPWTSSSLRDKYVCFQIVLAFQWAHRDGFRAQGQLLTPSELGDRSPQRRRRWSNSGSRVPDPVVRTKGILLCEQSVPTLSGPISELRWS